MDELQGSLLEDIMTCIFPSLINFPYGVFSACNSSLKAEDAAKVKELLKSGSAMHSLIDKVSNAAKIMKIIADGLPASESLNDQKASGFLTGVPLLIGPTINDVILLRAIVITDQDRNATAKEYSTLYEEYANALKSMQGDKNAYKTMLSLYSTQLENLVKDMNTVSKG